MQLYFLDTNVIIRYLTQDNPQQAEKAYQILQQVEAGAFTITTSEAVIVETVQVLSSKALYNLPRQEIRNYLYPILTLRGLKLSQKRVYLQALDLYASTNLDFVDALNIAHMERAKTNTIVSFDQDFDRIQGITRLEQI